MPTSRGSFTVARSQTDASRSSGRTIAYDGAGRFDFRFLSSRNATSTVPILVDSSAGSSAAVSCAALSFAFAMASLGPGSRLVVSRDDFVCLRFGDCRRVLVEQVASVFVLELPRACELGPAQAFRQIEPVVDRIADCPVRREYAAID